MKKILMSGILVAMFVTAGCSTRVGDFSVLSTGAPQYGNMEKAPMKQAVKGSDGRFWFLFIPFDGTPNIKEAVDRCLDEGKGDFMERARIYSYWWTFFGVFSYDSYSVVGDVGNSKFEQMKE